MMKAVPEQCLIEARNKSVGMNDTVCLATVQESIPKLALRYETWQHLVQVTAWILKWSRLCKEAKRGEAICKGIRRIWIHVAEKPTKRAIEELCNKGQVNQRSHIVTLHPQFDQTKRPLVVACHSGTETTLAFLREHFLAHTRTKWGKESFESV